MTHVPIVKKGDVAEKPNNLKKSISQTAFKRRGPNESTKCWSELELIHSRCKKRLFDNLPNATPMLTDYAPLFSSFNKD
jgi:hypothetical protein